MATSKFFEELPLLKDGSDQVGVCAMGPIGDGDELIWMRAWVWQQDGANLAAAAGNAGDHVPGAHPLGPDQLPPFKAPTPPVPGKEPRWMVQTKLEKESADFIIEKPALVQAIALVENGGDRTIVQWGQAVKLREPHPH
jgi:hypothetical protein